MKSKQWKLFLDFEKEEKWLNEKVAEGLAMTHYNLGRYTFEDCTPGDYIYRIELLKNRITHPDNVKYIRFMEDSCAEQVDSYLNWVYFRKKTTEGAFNIYTDLESRIAHYQRIIRLFLLVVAPLFLVAYLSQVITMISFVKNGYQDIAIHVIGFISLGVLIVLTILLFGRILPRLTKKVKVMKRERDIRE
jgi:hypothetical protein